MNWRRRPTEAKRLKWSGYYRQLTVLVVAIAVTASLIAACGDGGGTVAAPAETGEEAAPTGSVADNYKNKTIGVLQLTTADENIAAIESWMENAAEEAGLNWTWNKFDTGASPAKSEEGMNQFLAQDVDGIISIGVGAALIEAQLEEAEQAGLPTVGAYTFAPTDSSIGQDYTLPPSVDASLLASYLMEDQLNRHPEGQIEVALMDFPVDIIQERRTAVKGLLRENPRFEIVAEDFSVDPTNTEQDATQKAKAIMQANPDLDAIWVNYPVAAVPAASAVEQVGKTEDIQVYGHIANSAGVEAVRNGGALVATSWVDWPYMGYMMIDQMLLGLSGGEFDSQLSVLKPDPSIVFSAANVDTEVPEGTQAADWMFAGGTYRSEFIEEWNERYAE